MNNTKVPNQGIIARIQRHTREEYRQLLIDGLTDVRIWIQEHGEQAAVLGLVLGVFVVLFLKLVFWLVLLAVVAGLVITIIAPASREVDADERAQDIGPRDSSTSMGSDPPGPSNSQSGSSGVH